MSKPIEIDLTNQGDRAPAFGTALSSADADQAASRLAPDGLQSTGAVTLDLRRDLPKALALKDHLVLNVGACEYTAPCVIGAMIDPAARPFLDLPHGYGDSTIATLVRNGLVKAPRGQWGDLNLLQRAFDQGHADRLCELLEQMQRKYLPASVDTHPEGGDAVAAPFMSGAVGEAETPNG